MRAQMALRWAAAMEVREVGTRSLVAGMIREEGERSAPQQLLEAFGFGPEQLLNLMWTMSSLPPIDPEVARPASLEDLPPLSPNANRAIEDAFVLRDLLQPRAPVDNRHLFAAILKNHACTASQALTTILGGIPDLDEVGALLEDALAGNDESAFRLELDTLRGDHTAAHDELPESAPPGELIQRQGPVTGVAVSPDGGSIASVGEDGMLRVWNLDGDQPTLIMELDKNGPLSGVAFSPGGERVAWWGPDGVTELFTLEDRLPKSLGVVRTGAAPIVAATFSADNKVASVDHADHITVWSAGLEPLGQAFLEVEEEE